MDERDQQQEMTRDDQKPSQPPGATRTPNPGVGMGEGEKVAQEGCEGAGGVVTSRLNELGGRVYELESRSRAREEEQLGMRVGDLEDRVTTLEKERRGNGLFISDEDDSPEAEHYRNSRDVEEEMAKRGVNFSPGFTQIFTEEGARKYGLDPEKLRAGLEQMREGKEQTVKGPPWLAGLNDEQALGLIEPNGSIALRVFLRLAERWLPRPGSRWVWEPRRPQVRQDVVIESVRWNGEEFWVGSTAHENGVEITANNDLERFLEAAEPCSPAPPPCAEPAEETSSGGESCGEGTAGGARGCCHALRGFMEHASVEAHADGTIGLLDPHGKDIEDIFDPFLLCPWCASPLREDGELKVGSQGRAETSNPRENGDTLEGGEG